VQLGVVLGGASYDGDAADRNMVSLTEPTRRIAVGAGANIAVKAGASLVQILVLSVLPRAWGAEGFGQWLMIATIPTYLVFSGLGFGDAAATDMTRTVARGDHAGALDVLKTVWTLVTTLAVVVAAAVIAGLFAGGSLGGWPGDLATAGALLALFSVLAIQSSLLQAGYRACGRYAHGVSVLGAMAVIEGVAVVGVAASGGGLAAAALAMLIARVVGVTASWLYLRTAEPWMRLLRGRVRPEVLTRLRSPALAAVGLTAGDALALQGVVVTLGLAFSPIVTAVYASARSLCRLPLQASDVLGRATTPELTLASVHGDRALFDRLTRMNLASAAVIALPMLLVLAVVGPEIARRLSGGHLDYGPGVFAAMALVAAFQAVRTAIGQSLIALNEQGRYTPLYVICAALVVAAPFVVPAQTAVQTMALIAAALEAIVLAAATRGLLRARRLHFPPAV
jgi:O-antigen/teichoic acid export membrane protein